jgi:peptidylprolyl isomerase
MLKGAGDGGHPQENDCVKVSFTAWGRDGRFLFGSAFQGGPQLQCLRAAMPGVAEALRSMAIGEKRRLWLPAPLTTAPGDDDDERPSPVDITVDLELEGIIAAPATPTDLLAPPATALRLDSGVSVQTLQKGRGGPHPSASSRVRLHFSGWTREGRLFESTVMSGEPAVYLVANALPGWQEGLHRMVVGEKARFWIPAALAYGSRPGRRGVPTGDLVYDIELLALE